MMTKNRIPPKPFQSGQVWELEDSSVKISLVGDLLVHYKHYRGRNPRGPTSLASKTQLEQFLKEKKGILVQE
jgi:hypothetical protein